MLSTAYPYYGMEIAQLIRHMPIGRALMQMDRWGQFGFCHQSGRERGICMANLGPSWSLRHGDVSAEKYTGELIEHHLQQQYLQYLEHSPLLPHSNCRWPISYKIPMQVNDSDSGQNNNERNCWTICKSLLQVSVCNVPHAHTIISSIFKLEHFRRVARQHKLSHLIKHRV